jgi:hypothetical protein
MSGRPLIHMFAVVFLCRSAAAPAWSQEPPPAPEEIVEVEDIDVPAPPAPNGPAPAEMKAEIDAAADEFIPQLRPLLRAELHLIHKVCATSKDDQRALAKEGDRILKKAALKAAEHQVKAQNAGVEGRMPDIIRMIQDGLATAVSSRLTRRQSEAYQAEIGQRARFERDTAARGLVARFDGLLGLSADQRGKIAASLLRSQGSLGDALDDVLNDSGEYPTVPAAAFVPHLDARAKKIFQETQNSEHMNFEIGIVGFTSDADDFAEEDDPVDAAREKIRRVLKAIVQSVSAVVRPMPMGLVEQAVVIHD